MAATNRLDAVLATELNVAPPPVSDKERELSEASVERTRKIHRHEGPKVPQDEVLGRRETPPESDGPNGRE
jgi:hypothetical protein